jgi:cytochrome c1
MRHPLSVKSLLFALLVLSVGCGKKDKDAAGSAAAGSAAAGSAAAGSAAAEPPHHPHHLRVAAELAKVQDTLGEKWHAPKGEQRMKDACAAVASMETVAAEAVAAPGPSGADAAKWTAGTKELSDSVAALKTSCGGTDLAAFEPAFEKAHSALHALIGMTGGHHEGDGTHEHQL